MSVEPTSNEILHHVSLGQGENVVLFVHGFPLHHAQWQPQLEYFSQTHRIIAPDLRGSGRSAISDPEGVITMEQHADDLVALLDHLSIVKPVTLIGLSMGGYVAWQMARKYPQRLKSLMLCHTRVVPDTPEQAQGRFQLAAQTVQEQSAEAILKVMLPRLLSPVTPASVREAVCAMARSSSPAGLAATARGLAIRPDAAPLLANIHLPCLVISGEHDAISPPAEMSAWAAKLPDSRFISLPGVGHLSPLEAPELFNQTLTEFAPW